MGYRILALVENNIATTFLLASRLGELGHHVEVLSDAGAFRVRLAAHRFDWLLVDGDVARAAGKNVLDTLNGGRGDSRIVWFGRRPRHGTLAITAHFAKPISYAELSRYFSAQGPADRSQSPGHAAMRVPRERSSR